MNNFEALLIGGTNHSAVIRLLHASEIISIAKRGKLVLLVNGQNPPAVEQEEYQKLTNDAQGRSIYVIATEGTTANETFVNYIFGAFINPNTKAVTNDKEIH